MTPQKFGYWSFATAATVLAFLPHYWVRWFGYRFDIVTVDFVCAGLWTLCFTATASFARLIGWRRWWVAVTGPFALFRAGETLLTWALWKLFGFAP